ncbi:MAG: DUF4124 domain-containing protein [Thiotrichaceae bacterium]|nr:DUF4124 domain-containing protein [Thiotrichaceae bacterium]
MNHITKRVISLSLITIFSCALTNTVLAEKATEIYKWADKEGRIHYAAKPGDTSAKKMHLGSSTFKREKTNKEPSIDVQKDNERAMFCQESKDALAKYKKAPFLYRYDDERKQKVRLTKEESKETFLQAEKDVNYWCNPPQETENSNTE